MSLQGPIVVIADKPAAEIIGALAAGGAFPVVEATWADAPAAIGKIAPAAVILADPDIAAAAHGNSEALCLAIFAARVPYMPVLERVRPDATALLPHALPIGAEEPVERTLARLAAALRVRTLDLSVRRRAETVRANGEVAPVLMDSDPLDDATVLVLGRGRTYPKLSVAVGERVGLIGALSIDIATRYLNARDIDGVFIGDGFGSHAVEAFLQSLADDARFRDLPIALLPGMTVTASHAHLPNMETIAGEPADMVARFIPLVRQHAYATRLQRLLAAIEAKGMVDPETGLFTVAAFLRDLQRAIPEAAERGSDLSIARFSFDEPLDQRMSLDAARLVSRLVRSSDFACQTSDGSILLVFSATTLRSAHVVARRIASVLKHTMLTRERRIDPTITLATLKASDTVETLIARVNA
jgi:GGDEF domain-containing protein